MLNLHPDLFMQFALCDTFRKEAEPKLKGICPHCLNEVISKCGSKNIWHWAHVKTANCDSWYEPETQWHRNWKKHFGQEYSEIRIQKENAYHIADVLNKSGIIFEFQNSPISADVIKTREDFYGDKMIWVINGFSFKDNFKIYEEHFLKHWKFTVLNEFTAANYPSLKNSLLIEEWQIKLEEVKDFIIRSGFKYYDQEKVYSLNLTENRHSNREQLIFKLENELSGLYLKHKKETSTGMGIKAEFTWDNPRRSWQEAQRPVFIDSGEDFLFLVSSGIGKRSGTGTLISKVKFLEKYC